MIERHFRHLIRDRWAQARCLYVGGARQVGKTTLLRGLFPELPYVNLETPETRAFAASDPKGFLREHPGGAILDEVQRAPALFSWLQESIDSGIRWILSGSQNYLLLESI
jgi:predicted AAA+ superfamily ATPase